MYRGSFFLNLGDIFYNENLQNLPHRVALRLQEQHRYLKTQLSSLRPILKPHHQNLILLLAMSSSFILPNQWSLTIIQP